MTRYDWNDGALPCQLAESATSDRTLQHVFAGEHAALLQDSSGYDLLHRKGDLFAEGVATIFGIRQGEAELHTFCFDALRFSPEEAQRWLRDRGVGFIHFSEATGNESSGLRSNQEHGISSTI